MDWLTFISSVIGNLAWPATILAVVFMLRKPIAGLLPDLRKLKYKDLEVDFGQGLERAEKQLDEVASPTRTAFERHPDVEPEPLPKTHKELVSKIADLSPSAAILESWKNVERALDFYFSGRGIKRPISGQSITGHLDYDPNFPPQLVSAYQELRVLRNKAVHEKGGISPAQAREFDDLASRLTLALIEAAHSGQR
jgi:hypothetical protein